MGEAKIRARREAYRGAMRMILIGAALIVGGFVGLAVPFIGYTTAQDWGLLEDEVARYATLASVSGTTAPTPAPDTVHRAILNRLIIPTIGVDMPILQGDESSSLWKGGWLFPGTALPGQQGKSVIFGHRFRYLPPISNTFFRLDQVAVGDEFRVLWEGKRYTYRVIVTNIIEPTDFSILQPVPGTSLMALITCAPAFSTKYRLVVIGELVVP